MFRSNFRNEIQNIRGKVFSGLILYVFVWMYL